MYKRQAVNSVMLKAACLVLTSGDMLQDQTSARSDFRTEKVNLLKGHFQSLVQGAHVTKLTTLTDIFSLNSLKNLLSPEMMSNE
mgnify:CR=1 FL=1